MNFKEALKKNELLYNSLRSVYRTYKILRQFVLVAINKVLPLKRNYCTDDTLRCESDFKSVHYAYSFLGKDTPKCCANHLYELMRFVDEIFRKYHMEYVINYGTLLGAIRHKGLIPWDTDIDVSLDVDIKEKMLKVLEFETQDKSYIIKNEDTKDLVRLFFSKENSLHIDFYFYKKDDKKVYIRDDGFDIDLDVSEIYPLKEYPFYDLLLFGPAKTTILTKCYGDDVLEKSFKQWSFSSKKRLITEFKPAEIE